MKISPVCVHDRLHIEKVFIAKTRKNFFQLKYIFGKFYLPLAIAKPNKRQHSTCDGCTGVPELRAANCSL
jgi:hypothetical protein